MKNEEYGTNLLLLDLVKEAVRQAVPVVINEMEQRRKRMPDATLLTLQEAAAMMGISIRQVQIMVRRGDIPAVRDGRVVRIDRRDIEKWIEKHKR